MTATPINREEKAMSEREKMLDKVRALMAKTVENGCTEQEEMAALAKARALIDAFEISDSELSLTKEERRRHATRIPSSVGWPARWRSSQTARHGATATMRLCSVACGQMRSSQRGCWTI